MSTWRLFRDSSGDCFRWEVAGRILQSDSEDSALETTAPLPSMNDLLLQGWSKLTQGDEAMFRTGLGNSAKSVLADEHHHQPDLYNTGCSNLQVDSASTFPMFRTASGHSVPFKDSSIAKALSILGASSDNVPLRESGVGDPNSFFQTASNKKVIVSSAALSRANALLGLEDDAFDGFNHLKPSNSSHQKRGCSEFKTHPTGGLHHHSETPGQYEGHVSRKISQNLYPPAMLPPTNFQTAGGKTLSVSAQALKRARNLLGDPDSGTFFDDVAAGDQFATPQKVQRLDDMDAINSRNANTGYKGKTSNKHSATSFVSPLRSSSKQFTSVKLEDLASGGYLIKKFDAAVDETDCALNITKLATNGLLNNMPLASNMAVNNAKANGFTPIAKQFGQPLVDITNRCDTAYANNKQDNTQKKRLGKTIFVSPFKRPRNSSFKTPLKKNAQHALSGLSIVSSDTLNSKKVLSTRYPDRSPRVYIKDYFRMHPTVTIKMNYVPDHVRRIKSSNADKYVFCDKSSSNMVGAETFFQMLAESGASLQQASRKWVINHYRWIVWKLACYETCYPVICRGNFLTITNVLEELKYRYDREVNHGHCSAIKRILSGDAPASSMMVLYISAINPKTDNDSQEALGSGYGSNVKVELSDGWYSMNAALDVNLTKQLNAGKLFVGQKLRILGAGLSGWATPTSPLEAGISNTICLLLNINGTYRAHWADRLGFCKEVCVPLAFNCIKGNGGPVPKTLAGITRIYPILYKERLGEKKSIVRSERMESRMIQLHNQRRSDLVEGLMCEYERAVNGVHSQNDTDSEEGAKVFKLLKTASEPELLMAEMSLEQLTSFTTYKSKFEMENSVAKALEDAGLGERDVTPFMRIRLVGLTSLSYEGKHNPKEGIVTIWNPTERQRTELTEGKIYVVKGLVPMISDSETLYLHARGSSSRWEPLSPKASSSFQPFFKPRKPISLTDFGGIPLSSEFDIAAYVVYVGNVYTDVEQKKQWVFVTDGSTQHSRSGEISNSLLAISFSTPSKDDLPTPHISQSLVGSVVGFCNLIKRAKDAKNDMWVGEATENSVYSINAEASYSSHLKTSSSHIQTWAKLSSFNSVIHKLRQRVLFIIGASTCSR
ncbi:protein BREAST CANCER SUSCEPTIBILITY 2 homolog B isoform X2 [Raphanus sativus]|uniref:Protein BREAST CANCER SUSCEPTIBILITY 2 homolog B isoform X2 n=1 Tax=Raphanus sativus TaxID=3726 RepID=A0A6J0MPL6_RAPSA|nr:protein BREAST CANCER SUSCEPTIBILITY 2 homolog B isoform X2 [Raphanus sativus]